MNGYLIVKFRTGQGIMYQIDSRDEYNKIVNVAKQRFGNRILHMGFLNNVIYMSRVNSALLGKLDKTTVILTDKKKPLKLVK